MELLRPNEFDPHGFDFVARQSRILGGLGMLVLAALLAGASVLWWYLEAPAGLWIGCGLLALFLVPGILRDLSLRCGPTNWLLCVRTDGLFLHLRSYRNAGLEDAPTVLELDYPEIASAGRHVARYTTPADHGARSTRWKEQHLELQLTHDRTDALRAALTTERNRSVERTYLGGWVRTSSKVKHYPVTLPEPDRIRIAWRGGHGDFVIPSLSRVLEELEKYVPLAEPSLSDFSDWTRLSEAELKVLLRDLIRSGRTLEAKKLLSRRLRCSMTEAHRMVAELEKTLDA